MNPIHLRLGHSPDPDDAFMFYALAKDKIPTGPYRFEHILQDIQTLNQRAMNGELEITAISIHAYPYVADKYALTSCGSSMGDKYGPMVVARQPMSIEQLKGKTIAIPGKLTTAFLALQLCLGPGEEINRDGSYLFPNIDPKSHEPVDWAAKLRLDPVRRDRMNLLEAKAKEGQLSPIERREHAVLTTAARGQDANQKSKIKNQNFHYVVVPFDQILQYVGDGHVDAGLVIHEGQLTYQTQGLHLIVDLGVWWHEKTGLPLPLGGNCIRRDLGPKACQEVTDILKQSIQYSLDHRAEAVEYALQYGRDLDRKLADEFVGMYVNHWTLDYGPRGREAITRLLNEGAKAGIVPPIDKIEFVNAK